MIIATLEIKNEAKALKVVQALCDGGNYQEIIQVINPDTQEVTEEPNTILKPEFAKLEIIKLTKDRVKRQIQRDDEPVFHASLVAKKDAIDEIEFS